jgi:hypothetical protein
MTETTCSCSTLLAVTTGGVIVCLVVIQKLVQFPFFEQSGEFSEVAFRASDNYRAEQGVDGDHASWSSSDLASLRTRVSKPSVNQP